jgi:hypothetical protein
MEQSDPCMMQSDSQSPTTRRAVYLEAATELRRMAYQAQSVEMQRDFMRLVVLYEELAEYTARYSDTGITTEMSPKPGSGNR